MAIPSYTDISTQAALSPGKTAVNYSGTLEESGITNEVIPFGFACYEDTDGYVKIIANGDLAQISARNQFGIALQSPLSGDVDNAQYVANQQIGVGRFGYFAVKTNETVAKGDVVRVYVVADTGKLVGEFCKTAATGKTAVVNGARFHKYESATCAVVFLPPNVTLTAD